MAFGKLDKYIVNYTDVVLEFKKFQRYSIEYIKSANYFDQNYDIHRMLLTYIHIREIITKR